MSKALKSRFISLRFQAAFILMLLFLVVVLAMSWLSVERMKQEFIRSQQASYIKYREYFHYLISTDVENLVHLSTEFFNLGSENKDRAAYLETLGKKWDDLKISQEVQSISILDQYTLQPIFSIGQSFVTQEQKRLLADISLERNQTQSKITCHYVCIVLTAVPHTILGTPQAMLMEQSLSETILQLGNINDLNVVLLGGGNAVQQDQKVALQPYIDAWQRHILTTTEFSPLIRLISQEQPLNDLASQGQTFKYQGRMYMAWAFALDPNRSKTSHYIVFIDDTTESIKAIREHFNDTIIVVLLSAIFLGGAIVFISMQPLGRIQNLARLLPQLAKQKFDVIPEKLSKKSNLFQDEIDVLENSSIDLSHQLAQLDKDIKEKTAELERIAMFDGLTGLANRGMFKFQLEQSIAQVGRHSTTLALVFVDLDKFKAINDTLGHDLGDEMLINVANRLKKAVRETDLVCRLGGDEFVIILNNIQRPEDAQQVMNKLMAHMNRPMRLGDYDITVTFSAGVAFAFSNDQDGDELLKSADIAMYEAKRKGRNGYEIFNEVMRDETSRKFAIENGFKKALSQDQLSLCLLPKKRMGETHIIGLEAHCIWHHPEQGDIFSEEFLPIIEQNTLFVEFSHWLVRRVLKILEQLDQYGMSNLHVGFNIPAKQFTNPLLSKQLNDSFSIYDGYQKRVDIEIMESVLLKDLDQAKQTMDQLKAMGFSLTMDHFGAGHASLASLSRLPFDYVKLDQEFVNKVDASLEEAQIIDAMVKMSHQLGLEVIADGVTNQEQYDVLHKCNCDYAQGIYISQPIPESKILDYIDPKTLYLITHETSSK